jgi:integrase
MLARDPQAVAADLPDFTTFLLATGVRIGEALGLMWSEVDLGGGEVAINAQVMRVTGVGLVRGPTKSAAGQRVLRLPRWCLDVLVRRAAEGIRPEEPVFSDALGGFRDPNKVRRDLRRARAPRGNQTRQDLGTELLRARRAAGRSRKQVAAELGWPMTRMELVETGRVRLEHDELMALADLYRVRGAARSSLLALGQEASRPSEGRARLDHLAHVPQDHGHDPR